MFLGVLPLKCISQIFKTYDFSGARSVHSCCSGTFRLERSLLKAFPAIPLHANDVSLFSCAIGGLAMDRPVAFTFTGELERIETEIAGASPVERVAAVLVAFELARYASRSNLFAQKHFDYYLGHFHQHLEAVAPKVKDMVAELPLTSFAPVDWLEHLRAGVEAGSTITGFPPFTKGGYETQFKFLNQNVAWEAPRYSVWNPADLRKVVAELDDAKARYCLLTDQLFEDKEPILKYTAGLRLPHYCYANAGGSSLVAERPRAQPFHYRPIDVTKLSGKSKVEVVPAQSAHMNFVKDIYLSKSITHVSGLLNWLVFIDGMLAGSIIYDEGPVTRMAYGPRTVNLLSDLSISREGRLSKLIAMMALSKTLLRPLELKLVKHYDQLVTTAFTRNPNSMKYRGVLKKLSMRENDTKTGNVIQYGGSLVDDTPQQIFDRWWTNQNASRPKAPDRNPQAAPGPAPAPAGERPLHDGGPTEAPHGKRQARRRADEPSARLVDAG